MPSTTGSDRDLGVLSVTGVPRDDVRLSRTDVGGIRRGEQLPGGRSEQHQAALMGDREVDHKPVTRLGRGIESNVVRLTVPRVEIELPVRGGSGGCRHRGADEHHLELARGAREPAVTAGGRDRELELVVEWPVHDSVDVEIRAALTEVAEREAAKPVDATQPVTEDEA
jgi:hypothetical protein